jgi:hypothetical protein
MNFYGIDIQVEPYGIILIEGMRFNIGGLQSLRKLAERHAKVQIWLDEHGAVTISEDLKI